MSRAEERLRDAFRADAETVRAETIRGVPLRPARGASGRAKSRQARMLIPVAAAAAVVAIAVGISLITLAPQRLSTSRSASQPTVPGTSTPPSPSSSNEPASNAPLPVLGLDGQPASKGVPASPSSPGAPQYYVAVVGQPNPSALAVHATATGSVVGTIEPPQGTFFTSIAATAGDRTFITDLASITGADCSSQLYQFQLNDQGMPGPLTPLNITLPGIGETIGGLAITADGRTIAYEARICEPLTDEVGVIDLASGHLRAWEAADPTSSPQGLSLSPDGSLLAYALGYPNPDGAALILSTSAPPGQLEERSRVVSQPAYWAGLADGKSTLLSCSATAGSVTYYSQSVAVHTSAPARRHVIASWNDLPSPRCWASLDPSGGYLLVQDAMPASPDVQPAILDLSTGQLHMIATPSSTDTADIAW